jgi:putative methionine-R-sulfoxide reductase with GAF domain
MQGYSGPDRRTRIDRRSGWDRRRHKENLSLLEMITMHDLERQCRQIASWLRQRFSVLGIGVSLEHPDSPHTYGYREHLPENTLRDLETTVLKAHRTGDASQELVLFRLENGKLTRLDLQEDYPQSTEQMVIAIPLVIQDRIFGTLVLTAERAAMHRLRCEEPDLVRFIPLISGLLYSAVFQAQYTRKIRFLKLYQTVSSALGYIGDLQELLATIITIVTTELSCEAGSVLLYDEDTNELEFFVAEGELGEELRQVRFPADKGIAGQALKELRTISVDDVKRCSYFYRGIDMDFGFETRSVLAAPLVSGQETVGVVEAINKQANGSFEREDEQILAAIADEVALAVKNAKLFDYVVDSYCKIRQGKNSCKGCKRPLKSWTPCARQLGKLQ